MSQEEANDHQNEEDDDGDLRDSHTEPRNATQPGQSGDNSEDEKQQRQFEEPTAGLEWDRRYSVTAN